MTRDTYERLMLDGYVNGLDAPDDEIERKVELDLAEVIEVARPAARDEFTDDEIDAHVELAMAA